jgi:hypothetical protein
MAAALQSVARFAINVLFYHKHAGGARRAGVAAAYLAPALVVTGAYMWATHPVGVAATKGLTGPTGVGGILAVAYALSQTHLTTQVIVYSMARDPVPVAGQAVMFAFPAVLLAMARLSPPAAAQALHGYLGVVVALYLTYVSGAMTQITSHLGIRAFVITPKPAAAGATPAPAPAATTAAVAASPAKAPAARKRATAPTPAPAPAAEQRSAAKPAAARGRAAGASRSASRARGASKPARAPSAASAGGRGRSKPASHR